MARQHSVICGRSVPDHLPPLGGLQKREELQDIGFPNAGNDGHEWEGKDHESEVGDSTPMTSCRDTSMNREARKSRKRGRTQTRPGSLAKRKGTQSIKKQDQCTGEDEQSE
jgi:hypothetical protein